MPLGVPDRARRPWPSVPGSAASSPGRSSAPGGSACRPGTGRSSSGRRTAGTSVSATCRSVTLSSSEPASRSPMRSSSRIRSRSRRLLRLVASRAMIDDAAISPDRRRSGHAPGPGRRPASRRPADAANVPSQVRPRSTWLARSVSFPRRPRRSNPRADQRLADQLRGVSREAEQLTRERVRVQQVAEPVGDHNGGSAADPEFIGRSDCGSRLAVSQLAGGPRRHPGPRR